MESKVGIELYLVQGKGIGGRLKQYPEDFKVQEEIDIHGWEGEGDYVLAKVWSRNWETNRLVRRLSKELRMSRRRIRFAGTKDKRAVTEQWMSFETGMEVLSEVKIKDVELSDLREGYRSLYIGAHRGNRFEIIIRDLDVDLDDAEKISDRIGQKIRDDRGFPNWFGVQRFGTVRPITHIVGKHIIQGDFETAVKTYVANPIEGEQNECYQVRRSLEETWDYKQALKEYPHILTFERAVIQELVNNGEDYISAIDALPDNLLKMFVHAYQSYIFNRILSERMKEGLPLNDVVEGDVVLPANRDGSPELSNPITIEKRNLSRSSSMVRGGKAYVSAPLFGLKTEFSKGEMGEIERRVVAEEGLTREDFVVPQMRKLSSRGTRRPILAPIEDFDWRMNGSGLCLSFFLQKGSYATCLLREFMKLPDQEVNRYS